MASTLTIPRRPSAKPATKAKAPARPLTNERLLKLAHKHKPPQSWFDQTDVPFTPTKE